MKILAALILTAALPALSRVEGLPQDEYRHEWSGWGVGSSVTYSHYTKGPTKAHPKGEEKTVVVRMKLTGIDGTKAKIKLEQLVDGEPAGSDESERNLAPEGRKKTGTETLDIDGKSIDCTIFEQSSDEKGSKLTHKLWLSKSVPGRVAKEELQASKGDQKATWNGRMKQLNQSKVIGGKTVSYAVYEMTQDLADGRHVNITRWVTEDVPGFIIMMDERSKIGDLESITRREVTQFDVK